MERIGSICISASLINPRNFFFFELWQGCKSCSVWCISEKTKVPFSTHDLIHFCNSYFICSMNLAPFKRHINHASSCCFGWQPFFLEIFPIARAHSTFMTRASPQGRRISNWKSLHWHWCLWRAEQLQQFE